MKPIIRTLYFLLFAVPLSYWFYHFDKNDGVRESITSGIYSSVDDRVSQLNLFKNHPKAAGKARRQSSNDVDNTVIYKCTDEKGRVTYTEKPCEGNGVVIKR